MARTDYATVADIQMEKRITFRDAATTPAIIIATKPSLTQVTAELTERHNIVDNALNRKYVTPVTGEVALSTLRRIVIDMMVGWIDGITGVAEAKVEDKETGKFMTTREANAFAWLRSIRNGKETLKGATVQTTAGMVKYNNDLTDPTDTDFGDDWEDIY